MSGRGFKVMRASRWCAAGASALLPASLLAQAAPTPAAPPASEPIQPDPNAPLDPMPDLGVAWPELNAKGTARPEAVPMPPRGKRGEATTSAGAMRYTLEVQGLSSVANGADLL